MEKVGFDLRTAHFEVKVAEEYFRLKQAIFSMLHFQNMLLILLQKNYQDFQDNKAPNLRDLLLNSSVLRCLASGADGGEQSAKLKYLKETLVSEPLFKNLEEHALAELKDKNVYMLVSKLKSAFKGFFTKRKKSDFTAKPPKPKKLATVTHFSIPIDQYAFSLKTHDRIRINLNNHMESFYLSHEALTQLVGNLTHIQSLELVYKHAKVYFALSYWRQVTAAKERQEPKFPKLAGLDLGIKNLAAIFVADQTSSSLIISGKKIIAFNAENNRLLDNAKSKRDLITQKLVARQKLLRSKGFKAVAVMCAEDPNYLALKQSLDFARREIAGLYEKRNKFFRDGMSKAASRILGYLQSCGVTTLYVSRNLGQAKQQRGLSKRFNKNFHPIPLLALIERLVLKGSDYGIYVDDRIDEAYTSKTSCISGDLWGIQERKKSGCKGSIGFARAKALNGKRVLRSQFRDKLSAKTFLADLNGAANHIVAGRRGGPLTWLVDHLWKLANPSVVPYDSLLLDSCLSRESQPRDPQRFSIAARLQARFA